MDARFNSRRLVLRTMSVVLLAILLALGCCFDSNVQAAGSRTPNFLIDAPTPQLARTVGEAAEKYRRDLAVYWLGRELPPWPTPCPIRVIAGPRLAAQGVTTYNRAPVRDFQMEVVGTPQRILDSVLPHEVTHTVLATHFGRPLPRWADEGICTTVEHASEKNKHEAKLREFLNNRRGIAMNKLFLMTEYPSDVLPMYAQGYSVCRFLIEQQDAPTFIRFLTDYMERPSWTESVRKHYGYESLAELQSHWLAWVSDGSGPVDKYAKADQRPNPNAGMVALASGQSEDLDSSDVPNERRQINREINRELDSATNAIVQPDAAASREPASTLASRSDDGWYQRKKRTASNIDSDQSVAASRGLDRDAAITPIMPPSVRESGPYSVSQPQPEMRMSRGGSVPRYPMRYPNWQFDLPALKLDLPRGQTDTPDENTPEDSAPEDSGPDEINASDTGLRGDFPGGYQHAPKSQRF